MTKKKYTHEYKVEAVKAWLDNGRRSKEVGEKLGINKTLFLKWYRMLNGEATAPAQRPITQAPGLSSSPSSNLEAENARLRRENERLKLEQAILKKTVAFISEITK